ncbi:hypothetical protein [Bythopirellula polymerisocia]|uniref:GHMP kinase C-terminal domain-containing protein n=1 Tax=Bythopirellula polymerisocia TaxID=2528003 RepID=A0A5C6CJ47_9BACT|nr:hypothetical protein [Bythopirellula polymerisocia]TWU22809.1 hypothetical protein Pla144_42700 [Bythopirellula polymerisocia]
MSRQVVVRTPCRLHFGLTSMGHCRNRPQFGGVGVMVDVPGVQLEIVPARCFQIEGPLRERVALFTQSVFRQFQFSCPPELLLKVISAPREHTGLGVGSQLALAVAAGLAESLGLPWRDPMRLCQLTGRGRRSAVGTYGFLMGGLIVDGGHLPQELLGRLAFQKSIPEEWQFILLSPPKLTGRSGKEEESAIANLPPVSERLTEELEKIVMSEIVPALQANNFEDFAQSIYHFGCLAGNCFSAAQGGTFSSPATANLVSWLRENEFLGVGQSSWGPTVFVITPNGHEAERLKLAVAAHETYREYEIQAGPAANTGVRIEVSD